MDATKLQGLLPPECLVFAGRIDDWAGEVYPQEQAYIARAVEKRQREFSAGRRLARHVLAQFNIPPQAILRDEEHVPIWPAGMVGSISHGGDLIVVALGPAESIEDIGVDVEPIKPLRENTLAYITHSQEYAWVCAQADPELAGKLVFSAKESVFKGIFPRCPNNLAFSEVELTFTESSFTAQVGERSSISSVSGRYKQHQNHVITAISIV